MRSMGNYGAGRNFIGDAKVRHERDVTGYSAAMAKEIDFAMISKEATGCIICDL